MTIFSENVATFTAPALKNSRQIFRDLGLYIFADSEESGFEEEIFSQATHIWLGEQFFAEWDENNSGKYIKISLIGEIEEIWNFSVEFSEWKITKITNLYGKIDAKIIWDCMQRFIEETYFMKDYGISNNLPKNWKFIFAKPETIISISENILYPSKEIISFPLNIDKNGKYIKADNLVKTIKFNEKFRIDSKRCVIIDVNSFDEIKIWNYNKEYTDILINLLKHPNWYILEECKNLIKEWIKIDYKSLQDLEKAFNEAKFSQTLGIKIKIATNGKISKK